MAGNGKELGAFRAARPEAGDLVDRYLENKVRAGLFGGQPDVMLGRLRIEGTLGQGAMGAVLSAFDPVLDRHVAIKSLRPGRLEEREQLLREARMLAKLDHANVVSIFDVVEDETGLYLVMEQLGGGDLRAWMQEGHSWQDTLKLFAQVGQGLEAAHKLGISHCDVKPENIVVSDQSARLIDFGLAHQLSDGPAHGGTKAYLAPERLRGEQGSAGADQYAFFVALVEACEGVRPTGDNSGWQTMPRWLAQVARRGLSEEVEGRFPDMGAAVKALQRSRPRSRAAAMLALATLVGASAVFAVQSNNAPELCSGASTKIDPLWNDSTQARLKNAFLGRGDAKAWAQVDAKLNRYVENWRKARTQSCVATRVHQEQSVELLDYSMACFDRRIIALEAVIQVFSEAPNDVVVGGALSIVDSLPSLAICTDPASLVQAVELPEGVAERSELFALQQLLEASRNLERRGEFKEALTRANALGPRVERLGYAPLNAQFLVFQAALQVTLGQLKIAEKTLREAASAASAAKDDRLVAEVWTRVLELMGQQSRYDEALTLEAVAITSAERIPTHRQTQARLQNALGGIYLAKARYADAYAAYETALAIQREVGADGNRALAPAIANFALAKWYRGDLAGARGDLQEALVLTLAELGPDHSRVAYIRQNIADLQMQLGEKEEAHAHYLEIVRIWKSSLGEEHTNLAYPYEQLALIAKSRGDFTYARNMIYQALELREKNLGPTHALVLQALSVAARILIAQETPESLNEADSLLQRALALQEQLGPAGDRHAVYTVEARAQLFEVRGHWKASLADRLQVLKLRRRLFGDAHLDTGYSLGQVGRMHVKLGQHASALSSFKDAQEIFDAHGDGKASDAIGMRQGRAEILAMQGKRAQAIDLFEEALKLAETAKLDRVFEVRLSLVKLRYQAGEKRAAWQAAQALRVELGSLLPALTLELNTWEHTHPMP